MSIRRTLALLSAAALVSAPAAASVIPSASAATSGQWYVAMGDSLAAGYQPGQGDDKSGGYVGGVLAALQKSDSQTRLNNLGCSGETTTSMTSGSICSYPEGSQLAAAEAFLKAHQGQISLVTLDLGANDIDKCITNGAVDYGCLSTGLAHIKANLPVILKGVRDAAPDARIVVANYYNPFLAAWLLGPDGQTLAKTSVQLQSIFNGDIADAAEGVGATLADVGATFQSTDFTPIVPTNNYGDLPQNVANICNWTWMCQRQNIHANDTGYAKIASTIINVIPAKPPTSPTSSPTTPPTSPTSSPSTTASSSSTSTSTVTGPPVVTDGPMSGGHGGTLLGLSLVGGAGLVVTGGAAWRVKRR